MATRLVSRNASAGIEVILRAPERSVSVLLMHHRALVRAGMKSVLERRSRYRITAQADSCAQATPFLATCTLVMAELSAEGLLLAQAATVHQPRRPVLFVCPDRPEPDPFMLALALGVETYAHLDHTEDLLQGLSAALEGETYLSPAWGPGLVRDVVRRTRTLSLSAREHEILALLNPDRPTQFLADFLGLSPTTVKSHLSRLYRKLGVKGRREAYAYAMAVGLTNLPRESSWP